MEGGGRGQSGGSRAGTNQSHSELFTCSSSLSRSDVRRTPISDSIFGLVFGAAFGCFMGRSKRVHVLIVINIFLEEIAKEINRHAGACEP